MRNAKINFITNHKTDNIKSKLLEFYKFGEIAESIDKQFRTINLKKNGTKL